MSKFFRINLEVKEECLVALRGDLFEYPEERTYLENILTGQDVSETGLKKIQEYFSLSAPSNWSTKVVDSTLNYSTDGKQGYFGVGIPS